MSFDKAFAVTIGHEGKYSNNPNDSGGETMYGITIATARAHGYNGPMRSMPLEEAKRIYKTVFWDRVGLDKIDKISERVAQEVFDTGVNMGPTRAMGFLQKALNALNDRGRLYQDQTVDGLFGPVTEKTFKEFIRIRKLEGEIVILKMLNVLQGAFYIDLAARRVKDEAFIFGWFRTRIDIPLR